jgi:hypothetical protein
MAAHAYTEPMVKRLRIMVAAGHPAVTIASTLTAMQPAGGPALSAESIRKKCCSIGLVLRPRKGTREIRFDAEPYMWAYFDREARRRGLTVAKFTRLLMRIIAADDVATAVLDDAPRRRSSKDAREAGDTLADALRAVHPERRNGGASAPAKSAMARIEPDQHTDNDEYKHRPI